MYSSFVADDSRTKFKLKAANSERKGERLLARSRPTEQAALDNNVSAKIEYHPARKLIFFVTFLSPYGKTSRVYLTQGYSRCLPRSTQFIVQYISTTRWYIDFSHWRHR
jgi:hypothetical protein